MTLFVTPDFGRALVRTGFGSPMVAFNKNSMLKLPLLHHVEELSIEDVHIRFSLSGNKGVVCKDGQMVNVEADYVVRINPIQDDVLQVLSRHGNKASDPHYIKELLSPKMIQAVRVEFQNFEADSVLQNYENILEATFMYLGRDLNGYVLDDGSLNITGARTEKAVEDSC